MANADLALEKGDTEAALNILRTVGPEQPYFVQAKEKMAQIYLNHRYEHCVKSLSLLHLVAHFRKDKRMYVQCFRQIVDKNSTPQNYVLLGDAYMAIEEPDKALEIYEQVRRIKILMKNLDKGTPLLIT